MCNVLLSGGRFQRSCWGRNDRPWRPALRELLAKNYIETKTLKTNQRCTYDDPCYIISATIKKCTFKTSSSWRTFRRALFRKRGTQLKNKDTKNHFNKSEEWKIFTIYLCNCSLFVWFDIINFIDFLNVKKNTMRR